MLSWSVYLTTLFLGRLSSLKWITSKNAHSFARNCLFCLCLFVYFCVEVLWSSQPNWVKSSWSVYLTILFLGRLSSLKWITSTNAHSFARNCLFCLCLFVFVCFEVLWPSQPNWVMSSWSVFLTTLFLGRLSSLNG